MNIYIDPSSILFLNNKIFDTRWVRDECLLAWVYFKKYCSEKNINVETIDHWDKNKATSEDFYVALDHKSLFKKIYWKFKIKNYPINNFKKFKKKILFQGEPPTVMPGVYGNINRLVKFYDELYFSSKINHPKCSYYHIPQVYNNILPGYWEKRNRKFLVMINSNRKPHSFSRRVDKYGLYHKELFSERIKAIEFFNRTKEIDLYGHDWDKPPFSPYQAYSSALKEAYKGSVESKYEKMAEYKLAICFENSITPGYITEKIFDCFYVGTVPIYLGAPDIREYIPKDCFIDMRDFKNYTDLRRFLKSLTEKEIENYRQNIRQFLESEKFKPFTKEYFTEKFVDIINKC